MMRVMRDHQWTDERAKSLFNQVLLFIKIQYGWITRCVPYRYCEFENHNRNGRTSISAISATVKLPDLSTLILKLNILQGLTRPVMDSLQRPNTIEKSSWNCVTRNLLYPLLH